jgi:hypothetical protein
MQVHVIYLPAGFRITVWVTYPNGAQVVIGDQYMADLGNGYTEAYWTWTVPADMILGAGRIDWHVHCTGRNMDAYRDFQVVP